MRGGRFTRVARDAAVVACVAALAAVSAPAAAHAAGSCTAAEHDYTITYTGKVFSAPNLLAGATCPNTPVFDAADSDTNSPTSGATFSWSATNNGTLTYHPDITTKWSGVDLFSYAVKDSVDGTVAWGTIQITIVPVIATPTFSTLVNHALGVAAPGALKLDVAGDAGRVAFDATSAPGGPVRDDTNGAFAYTPPHNFTGTDSFGYTVYDVDLDILYSGSVLVHVTLPPPPPPAKPKGYWMVGATGIVYPFGQVKRYGDAPTAFATHLEPTPSRLGYWVVDAFGRVYAFGDAHNYGGVASLGANEIVSSLSATPTGKGYWLFTNRGRVVARGDARFFGDVHALPLNGPVVGSIATPSGNGYFMVASDGGIFAFGDARFHGSMGGRFLHRPIVGMAATPSGRG